jgi:metal-sulfur cluster biosynthetic enzyme/nitrite reductase/ring-hydroxylating ferredoxin subunit
MGGSPLWHSGVVTKLPIFGESGKRWSMQDFQRVIEVGELADPGKTLVEIDGEMIALFHVGGEYFALDDVCTHDGGPLADGDLVDHTIACPRHGAKFDIRTGGALTMPAVRATRAHRVKLEDGGVWVAVGDSPASSSLARAASTTSAAASNETAPQHPAASTTAAAPSAEGAPPVSAAGPLSEESVRELLKEVKDPELFVNIVDLGLVYGVSFSEAEQKGTQQVSIDMTMTSPACPAGPQLIADTKRVVGAHPEVSGVEVRIVMDPPWSPERMTDDARDQLGIF